MFFFLTHTHFLLKTANMRQLKNTFLPYQLSLLNKVYVSSEQNSEFQAFVSTLISSFFNEMFFSVDPAINQRGPYDRGSLYKENMLNVISHLSLRSCVILEMLSKHLINSTVNLEPVKTDQMRANREIRQ